MSAIGPDGIGIVFSSDLKRRNSDVDYLFRPNSDFVYLTGFHEPESVLVLAPGSPHGEETLFVRPRDLFAEQWNGRRLGAEGVLGSLGISHANTLDQLADALPSCLEERQILLTNFDGEGELEPSLRQWFEQKYEFQLPKDIEVTDFSETLHELRLFKSDFEIQVMQQAAHISVAAHQRAMRFCEPGINELHLESELQHEFASHGARHTAYPSIVASGENACIMHYIENDATIHDGELVLIDAGCEVNCYASDITRTFPANGRFSAEQTDIYEIVLAAQNAAIDSVQTGNSFTDPHNVSMAILAQGLLDLGVLKGSLEETLEQDLAKPFTVHRCSHFLGLDVHDVGKREVNGSDRMLEPGMILTVEPGLYFANSPAMPDFDDCWRGIGIRIEDDVLVTQDGQSVLTGELPKQAAQIEELVNA